MSVNETRRRSSLFDRAKKSFFKSGGQRGCDIETLRGTSGADFEGVGSVKRVAVDSNLIGCLFCSKNYEKKNSEVTLLVKGPFCFVYAIEKTQSPMYAIGLHNMRPKRKDDKLVVLETSLGDPQYEIRFKDPEFAHRFEDTVLKVTLTAESDIVRKRLGHENLLSTRKSVAYAEEIALKKYLNEQPPVPISATEMIDAMPQNHAM